ncbi:sensor domain-containing protein [Megalodesulfovibrio gigas]|uniref:sensor domain-containing protein n=1 Tax=Megalodesulfovibrio gigas TaxID=879 RepID=UPI000412D05D|nr:EAL domain-containing protein [Megalodesulfovibrio gigas]
MTQASFDEFSAAAGKAISEAGVQSLFENAPVGILRCTRDGVPLLVNREAVRLFGYRTAEALLATVKDVPAAFMTPGGCEGARRLFASPQGLHGEELLLLQPDETSIWVQASTRVTVPASHANQPGSPLSQGDDSAGLLDLFITDIAARKRAEDALRQANLVVELSPVLLLVWEMEQDWPLVHISQNITLLGHSAKALLAAGASMASLMPPEDVAALRQEVQRCAAEDSDKFALDCRLRCSDGTIKWMETRITLLPPRPGLPARCQAIMLDVTSRKLAESRMLQQKAYFQQLFENSPQAIVICDRDGNVSGVNRAFEKMFGYEFTELWNKRLGPFIVPAGLAPQAEEMTRRLSQGEHVAAETIRRRKDGQIVHVYMLSFPIIINDEMEGAYRIFLDITERKRAEEQLVFHSFHDKLTGLPNRALLLDRLRRAMERAKRHGRARYALLYVDLDRFKLVNDSLGHAAGDQLIQITSQRIARLLQPIDTVSRLGGDEFCVLLDSVYSREDAERVARELLQEVEEPVELLHRRLQFTASIGIAMGDLQVDNEEMLLRDADIAMSMAKERGKNTYVVFDPSMRSRVQDAMRLETELRRAIAQEEIVAHYQPIVSVADNVLLGFEALARWRHPERGLIFPGEFIELAEETGLIVNLGRQILSAALQDLASWCTVHPAASRLTMSVNLSARQFMQSDLVEQVRQAVRASGMPAQCLCLELTESVVMENAASARVLLERLKALQVRLAVDDFGTGYSSLAYLHQFPLDSLKVDRSFVQRLGRQDSDNAIVHAIIQLAQALRLRVVAEGVEEVAQLEVLQSLGCDAAQGYLLGKPMPAEAVLRLLAGLDSETLQLRHCV